jgi:hypothetical protein
VEKVAGAHEDGVLAMASPTDGRLAIEDVDDGVLLAMVMDAGTGAGLDQKGSAPQSGFDAKLARDGGTPERTWSLAGAFGELFGMNDGDGLAGSSCHA